jgi:dipeptidyl aminopeptidase/acylaminoacyl peptidase
MMTTTSRVPVTPGETPTSARLPVTPGAIYDVRTPSDAQLTPDGGHIAFVVSEWIGDQPKRRTRIWTVSTTSGATRPLTSGASNDANPRWSPDGQRLAFTSQREHTGDDEKPQLYVMPAAGGQPRLLCQMPNGVSDPAWSPDGTCIAFLSLDGPPPQRDPIVVGPGRHRRLWTIRLDGDVPEPVTPPNMTVWEYVWSPDGRCFAVYYSTGPDETDWYRGQLGTVEACGGAVRQTVSLTRQAGALAWSPDGRRIAYISGEWSDRGLVGGELFVVPAEGSEALNLTPGIEFSLSWARWLPEGHKLLYAGWDGVTNQVGLLDEGDGARIALSTDFLIGERGWPRLAPSADLRCVAVTHSDAEHAPEIWLGELARKSRASSSLRWRQLTHLNALPEQTLAIAPGERISYTGAEGWRIEGIFTSPLSPLFHREKGSWMATSVEERRSGLPSFVDQRRHVPSSSAHERRNGAEKSAPLPLVVNVHGGPSAAWQNDWTGGLFTQMLASHGFAVLRTNIRGSLGRGLAFADAVLGDMGGKDLEDLLAGIDELVRRELVDGARVGICGWSYGGFMVAWAVSQTDRFKAAVMGAGICDYHSFHAQSNIPDWDMRFLDANTLDHPEAYRARSAITFANRIATPTLILHGEKDPCVPVNQAYAFHRALVERDVPVELVVYPREGHGLVERAHLVDADQRVLRWFKTYL